MEKPVQAPFQLTDAEAELLEALVRSPAFPVLRKVLDGYRNQCLDVLLTAKSSNELFEARGRVLGLNTIQNIGPLLVEMRRQRQSPKKEDDKK